MKISHRLYMIVEAMYAHAKNKPIVALRLEADYMPDGWLGPLCLNDLHYDFSDGDKFDLEWDKLRERLSKEIGSKATSHTTGLPTIMYVLIG